MRRVHSLTLTVAFLVLGIWSASAGHARADQGEDALSGEVVLVVSADNPATELTRDQVADIFLGKRLQYPDGRRAIPVDQAQGSPVREAFNQMVLQRTDAQVRAHWAKIIFTGRGRPPQDVSDDCAVKEMVAGNANAIGYIDRRLADGSVSVVTLK